MLRGQTRSAHEATELAFARYDIARYADYRAFLLAHRIALAHIEPQLCGIGWQHWAPRRQLVDTDLAKLGSVLPALPANADGTVDEAEAWGAQYVIEGSALGGAMLSRRVPRDAPTAYLAREQSPAASWKSFCTALDQAAAANVAAWLDEATAAANRTFAVFQDAARQMEPPTP